MLARITRLSDLTDLAENKRKEKKAGMPDDSINEGPLRQGPLCTPQSHRDPSEPRLLFSQPFECRARTSHIPEMHSSRFPNGTGATSERVEEKQERINDQTEAKI